MYGGSTAFGIDQRDDHTIASELARIAHADGIDIEVHNRGIPWYAHWQEAERFAWDLTAEGPPDLVLFYDGYNDLAMIDPGGNHWNGKDSPIDSGGIVAWDVSERSTGEPPKAPPGARYRIGTRPAPTEWAQAVRTLDRYEKARSISRAAAAAAGVPVRYLWQPTRYDRPLVEGEMHWATDVENGWRKVVQAIGDGLPRDVIDLRDVLDEHLEPIYTDDVHHNEKGARLIAEAIYDRIRPDLLTISRQPLDPEARPGS